MMKMQTQQVKYLNEQQQQNKNKDPGSFDDAVGRLAVTVISDFFYFDTMSTITTTKRLENEQNLIYHIHTLQPSHCC